MILQNELYCREISSLFPQLKSFSFTITDSTEWLIKKQIPSKLFYSFLTNYEVQIKLFNLEIKNVDGNNGIKWIERMVSICNENLTSIDFSGSTISNLNSKESKSFEMLQEKFTNLNSVVLQKNGK